MGNRSIERTLRRSYDDLGALRIEDPTIPTGWWSPPARPGSWRCSAGTRCWALMALPVDPSLALGTLQTLADRQGTWWTR